MKYSVKVITVKGEKMFRFFCSGLTRGEDKPKVEARLSPALQGMGLRLEHLEPAEEYDTGLVFEDAMNLTLDFKLKRNHKSKGFMKKLVMYPHRCKSYGYSVDLALDHLEGVPESVIIDLVELRDRLLKL